MAGTDERLPPIRDFAAKMAWLVGGERDTSTDESSKWTPSLRADQQGNPTPIELADGFPVSLRFGAKRPIQGRFAIWLRPGRNSNPFESWRDGSVAKAAEVREIAKRFGLWPKEIASPTNAELRSYWRENWPEWWGGPPDDAEPISDPPDTLKRFSEAYEAELRTWIKDRSSSRLNIIDADPDTVERIARLLETSAMAQSTLIAIERFPLAAGEEEETLTNDAVAKTFLSMTAGDAIGVLCEAHRGLVDKLRRTETSENTTAAQVVLDLARWIVPCLVDRQSVTAIRRHIESGARTPIELNVHHRTVAELIMAAADGRDAQHVDDGSDMPPGKSTISQALLETGVDGMEKQIEQFQEYFEKVG